MSHGKDRIEPVWIRDQVQTEEYEFSDHAERERQADRIPMADVERALVNAEILEDYPGDPRGPSCLIVGYGAAGYPIHMVCGRSPKALVEKQLGGSVIALLVNHHSIREVIPQQVQRNVAAHHRVYTFAAQMA